MRLAPAARLASPLRGLALLVASALALAPSAAHAGGLGLMGTAGFHGDRVYFYAQNSLGEWEQQAPDNQLNANYGGGLEVILGDKDNKILGIFRGYYLADSPEQEPADPEEFTFTIRDTARPMAIISAGLQFGIVGDPDKLQGNAIATIGSGFVTLDESEFFQAEAGIGGSYMLQRHVQAALWITGGVRWRGRVYATGNGYAGIRYLFD